MKESDKKNRKNFVVDAIVVALIVALIAIVIIILTHKKETHSVAEYNEGEASTLVCTSHNNESSFFKSDIAMNVKHVVKAIYYDDKISKMSYEYEGKCRTDEEADKDSGDLHTRYNLYLGEHGVKHEILAPVFQFANNYARIKLYLDDYGKMNPVISTIFYLDEEEIKTVGENDVNKAKKLYENKGFSCIIND